MPEFAVLNQPIVDHFETAYGAKPGIIRPKDERGVFRIGLRMFYDAYGDASLADQAKALNLLAGQMNRLGYGVEANNFVDLSRAVDSKGALHFDNLSVQAYATGLILGKNEDGLDLYMQVVQEPTHWGKATDIQRAKAWQNAGQILHRMGISSPEKYYSAKDCYAKAQEAIDNTETLTQAQRDQFSGQRAYCEAKTDVHMARRYEDFEEYLDDAIKNIGEGLAYIKAAERFDFERACFKAILGDILAATGNTDEARAILTEAEAEQRKYGPTLAPRYGSTMLKRLLLDDPQASTYGVVKLLAPFYGPDRHPDMWHYNNAPERNRFVEKRPQVAASLKL